MNFITKLLFSMPTMVVLIVVFAISCGVATFIENDFGTETAWALVYNSFWFEAIQILLGLNLFYNIIRFKLYKKNNLPSFVFHLSMIFILLGSGLTRYFGYEGTLHIREGQSSNLVSSSEPYIQFDTYKDNKMYHNRYHKLISKVGSNKFNFSFDVDGNRASVKYKEYIPRAIRTIVDDENGTPTIALTISNIHDKSYLILKEGDAFEKNGIIYSFNATIKDDSKPCISFSLTDEEFTFVSNNNVSWFTMSDGKRGVYESNSSHSFNNKNLYTIDGVNFAARYVGLKGKDKFVSEDFQLQATSVPLDVLIVELSYQDKVEEIVLFGRGRGYKGQPIQVSIGNTIFVAQWGSQTLELPFKIKLNDFQLERYPGSKSPSSYASEVIVLDIEKNVTKPARIYMNNVLDYRGYRFFQASYDKDELGTVLSVNRDPGKFPTYLGYFLLSLGLLWSVLNPKSRFRKLASLIHKDTIKSGKKTIVSALFLVFATLALTPNSLEAQVVDHQEILKSLSKYDKEHADYFATILVQSTDGRIKPIDTLSSDILNKVYRSNTYEGLSANQVILGMIASAYEWQTQPMIRVSHPELKKLIGVEDSVKYAKYDDFFDLKSGQYKLIKNVEASSRKKDAEKNQFDKDILKVDERINILYYTYTLEAFRIFPKAEDIENRWYSTHNAITSFSYSEIEDIKMIVGSYFDALEKGLKSGNWSDANKAVDRIKAYQEQFGKQVMPSQNRVKAELFFNKANIFDRLTLVYLFSGLILLIFIFVKMAKPKIDINPIIKGLFYINLVAFVVHTFGLGLRWYIAQHAPWSNGYESMIYIAWAIALAGLFFSKTSIISMALTYILAGITLHVAHLSWMDAQITNLVPVLKSYWLTIHVSVITASYGFLGLCSLLGFFVLILYIIKGFSKDNKYKDNIERNITEATRINEMSMILGLSLLAVGNFLGGVWANESWGRYWGWDPKETWSLVSILIYAAVVHFRFIPKMNNQFIFAIFSTISYASIIMTYFGVNYYLSGMHSYAAGDPVPIPAFVYYITATVFTTIILSIVAVVQDNGRGRFVKKL